MVIPPHRFHARLAQLIAKVCNYRGNSLWAHAESASRPPDRDSNFIPDFHGPITSKTAGGSVPGEICRYASGLERNQFLPDLVGKRISRIDLKNLLQLLARHNRLL